MISSSKNLLRKSVSLRGFYSDQKTANLGKSKKKTGKILLTFLNVAVGFSHILIIKKLKISYFLQDFSGGRSYIFVTQKEFLVSTWVENVIFNYKNGNNCLWCCIKICCESNTDPISDVPNFYIIHLFFPPFIH